MKHPRRPSPSMVVSLVALFVALGGAGYAATGGTFILGASNAAGKSTRLVSGVTSDPTLRVRNNGGQPAAAFATKSASVPSFAVSNGTKIPNLNADSLDGFDGGGFVQGAGGRTFFARKTATDGNSVSILTVPGFVEVQGSCGSTGEFVLEANSFGETALVQVGQTYTPPGKLPRNRVATFSLGARFASTCRFQAQGLVQG